MNEYKIEDPKNTKKLEEEEDISDQDLMSGDVNEFYESLDSALNDESTPLEIIRDYFEKISLFQKQNIDIPVEIIYLIVEFHFKSNKLDFNISNILKMFLSDPQNLSFFINNQKFEEFMHIFSTISNWFTSLIDDFPSLRDAMIEHDFISYLVSVTFSLETYSQQVFIQNIQIIIKLLLLLDKIPGELVSDIFQKVCQFLPILISAIIDFMPKEKEINDKFNELINNTSDADQRNECFRQKESFIDQFPKITALAKLLSLLNTISLQYQKSVEIFPQIFEELKRILILNPGDFPIKDEFNFDTSLCNFAYTVVMYLNILPPPEIIKHLTDHLKTTNLETHANSYPQMYAKFFYESFNRNPDEMKNYLKEEILDLMFKLTEEGTTSQRVDCFLFFVALINEKSIDLIVQPLENRLMHDLCDIAISASELNRKEFMKHLLILSEMLINKGLFTIDNPIVDQVINSDLLDFLDGLEEMTEEEIEVFQKFTEISDIKE
ncbi:hypothetical protein TVAG_265980 [Trichomonas vaginalis G3]|uniref:Uncharacterized protein n=1 Tax=Trichomonas vaginalis (strain ATCC PRA-98 / G3) TaxID=412133 RepID=A2F2J5_TRIV3|nr:armadillo (ARM) repeat-containing protein family [Trichomonas vaginalis G3]EAY00895.1 hypothetical protein TVAG_265980 [Trichomonas vaginalis G3]KAI5489232.1 armadillo (ARM) repeat-containing protein family [Trichomonas vaginalis G3]|eukprot:XP_001313824.1 hypothetical protein [Trichomonas vaginalis G3]